ncbi:MAG: EH signature domain-containing protein, partial [Burkholderiales bacterium]|nr:EH signature domain-containing protein [Burkholderiales bacterium]
KLLAVVCESWGNPRLINELNNRWSQASRVAHRLVMSWLNEDNLRLFFELLDARGASDPHNRKQFWLRYVDQMVSSRLVLGSVTRSFLNKRRDIKHRIFDDDYVLARLDGSGMDIAHTDAFIMIFREFIVVDFHPKGGGYIYPNGTQLFDIDSTSFSPGTQKGGLKENYPIANRPDITHSPNWELKVERMLKRDFNVKPVRLT